MIGTSASIARRTVAKGLGGLIATTRAGWSQSPEVRLGQRRTVHFNFGAIRDPLLPAHDGITSFGLALRLEDMPYAVRVGFGNDIGYDYPVSAVAACISSSYADGVNPTGGCPWALLTTSAGGRDTADTAVSSGASRNLLVRGNGGGARVPTIAWTDWTPITAIPPDDGSGRPILFLRASVPAWVAPRCCNALIRFSGTPAAQGRDILFTYRMGQDLATEPGPHANIFGPSGVSPFYCVQYLSHSPGATLLWSGDSQFAGDTSIGNADAFPLQSAFALSTPKRPLAAANYAWSGSPSLIFMPILEHMLDACRPSIVVLQGWTGNDGPAPAAINAYAERVLKLMVRVRQLGILPILVTRFPRINLAEHRDQLALAEHWRQVQLKLNGPGSPVLDAAAILDDPARPGAYRAGLSNDGVHPNTAGHIALAQGLTPILQGLLRNAE